MSMTQEEIEALMNDTISDSSDDHNIDDLLAGIDGIVDVDEDNNTDMDALLSSIDGVIEDAPTPKIESTKKTSTNKSKSEDEDSIDKKIDKGIYPMPVEKEHKVVNQLNEVAEDSEAKASQIFDVLSFILDENDLLQRNTIQVQNFIDAQIKLLETLNNKFPNIDVFGENLEKANEVKNLINEITSGIEDENNKVFEAMELMQYHDINRQKIERVMAVIRKLALYLNGLFEDDSNKPEVQIAKHISGDSSQTVSEDDLDSLIAEFSKEDI